MATPPDPKLAKLEEMARRIKRVMYAGATHDTAGLVHAVIEQWATAEGFEPDPKRSEADNYEVARRRVVEQLGDVPEALLSERALRGIVDDAELLVRVRREVDRLKRGEVEQRAQKLLTCASQQVGSVLALVLEGRTDHEVAQALGITSGAVELALVDGIRYLTRLLINTAAVIPS